jgi:putative phosphoesterase
MQQRIGIISDTHGYLDPLACDQLIGCDEIWHVGDFGTAAVADELEALGKPFRAVYGNIDDNDLRERFPEDDWFDCCGVDIWMTHIAGYPKHYSPRVRSILKKRAPQLLLCGHSHILRLDHDQQHRGMLCMNPGAAGHHGFHLMRTIMIVTFSQGAIAEINIIELGPRGRRHTTAEDLKTISLGSWRVPARS